MADLIPKEIIHKSYVLIHTFLYIINNKIQPSCMVKDFKRSDSMAKWGIHGRDRMVVGFITTFAISAFHH